jgi:hypothetical protein
MLPNHCKTVSVTDVDIPLTPGDIAGYLLGRRAFTRTEYMVLRGGEEYATARVEKKRGFQLFRPIMEVEVLSTPGDTLFVRSPDTDILNPTWMYRAAVAKVGEVGDSAAPKPDPDSRRLWKLECEEKKHVPGDGVDGGKKEEGNPDPLGGWTVVVEGEKAERIRPGSKISEPARGGAEGGEGLAEKPGRIRGAGSQATTETSDPLKGWTVVVEGVDGHISFIHRPNPWRIMTLDIVPPEPSRLMRILERALDAADTGGEPVEFIPTILDINELTRDGMAKVLEEGGGGEAQAGDDAEGGVAPGNGSPACQPPAIMYPCEAGGLGVGEGGKDGGGGRVSFLDKTPELTDAEREDTALVGCDTSRMIFRSLYGRSPPMLDICPAKLMEGYPDIAAGPSMIRCCKMYSKYDRRGDVMVLPWGPTVKMAARAIEELTLGVNGEGGPSTEG